MSKIKCIALRTCQTRGADGKIRFYDEGAMDFFEKIPKHFAAVAKIAGEQVDFDLVGEAFLREGTIPVENMVAYYKDKYGEDLTGLTLNSVVDHLLFARSNPVQTMSTPDGTPPTARDFKNKKGKSSQVGAGITVEMENKEVEIPKPPVEESSEEDKGDLDSLLK